MKDLLGLVVSIIGLYATFRVIKHIFFKKHRNWKQAFKWSLVFFVAGSLSSVLSPENNSAEIENQTKK